MKRTNAYFSGLLLFFAFLVSGVQGYSQTALGIKGGVNFSNYGNTFLTDSYDNKVSPAVGFVADFQQNDWFSIQTELFYEVKGANYTRVQTSQSGVTTTYKDFEEDLHYLTVPAIGKFDIGETGRAFGYAGLYLGYLIYADIKGTVIIVDDINPDNSGQYQVDREYTSDIDRFDFGAVMGLGLDYTINDRYRVFADGRFNWGWANVARPGNGKIFNQVWSVNLGLMYHLPE